MPNADNRSNEMRSERKMTVDLAAWTSLLILKEEFSWCGKGEKETSKTSDQIEFRRE